MNDSTASAAHQAVDPADGSGHYGQRRSRPRPVQGSSPFVPMLIFLLGMVAWSGFQLHQLSLEFDALGAARGSQETQLQQAQRVRQALESVANETRKLADAGNANAKSVVDELRKRGVTINPAAGAKPDK